MTMLRVRGKEDTLLDVLDRLLDKGVVVAGDLTLSVAEVDLIFASLRLVVASVDRIREAQGCPSPNGGPSDTPGGGPGPAPAPPGGPALFSLPSPDKIGEAQTGPLPGGELSGGGNPCPAPATPFAPADKPGNGGLDPDKTAKGLAQLALTIVDLLRKLLEREALRRMERGTLTLWEVERLGQAFFRLEQKMRELKEFFHLGDQDLNLDLGPLGRLM